MKKIKRSSESLTSCSELETWAPLARSLTRGWRLQRGIGIAMRVQPWKPPEWRRDLVYNARISPFLFCWAGGWGVRKYDETAWICEFCSF